MQETYDAIDILLDSFAKKLVRFKLEEHDDSELPCFGLSKKRQKCHCLAS